MREDDDERAVGRAGEFGRRFGRVNKRDVRGRVRRKSIAPGINPAHRERQRRERERQRPSDVTGAEQIDRARKSAERFGPVLVGETRQPTLAGAWPDGTLNSSIRPQPRAERR